MKDGTYRFIMNPERRSMRSQERSYGVGPNLSGDSLARGLRSKEGDFVAQFRTPGCVVPEQVTISSTLPRHKTVFLLETTSRLVLNIRVVTVNH